MRAVVGLGNPGPRYAQTRHNAGRMALAEFAGRRRARPLKPHPFYEAAACTIGGGEVWLVAPSVFMNESGRAVEALPESPLGEDLVVLSDDMDLPFGTLRLRRGGSDGGHRGLRDIIARLGSDDFVRLRLGIGRAEKEDADTRDFVLSEFNAGERAALPEFLQRAADALETLLTRGLTAAMNQFNRAPRAEPLET